MELTIYRPNREISPLLSFGAPFFGRQIDEVFDRLLGSPFFETGTGNYSPPVEVSENEDEVKVRVELPGVDEKEVSTTLSNGSLVIKGEKKSSRESKNDLCYCSERSYGMFERVVDVPTTVDPDRVSAHFEHGVLEVILPKKEEARPKQVKIEAK